MLLDIDEMGYVQGLDSELGALVEEYYRECRALGIWLTSTKQRPQGAVRAMHSESSWTAAFQPKDQDDGERVAEVFGSRRQWMPVLDQLDRAKREFLIKDGITGDVFISWIDTPFKPVKAIRNGGTIYGKSRHRPR